MDHVRRKEEEEQGTDNRLHLRDIHVIISLERVKLAESPYGKPASPTGHTVQLATQSIWPHSPTGHTVQLATQLHYLVRINVLQHRQISLRQVASFVLVISIAITDSPL